VFILTHPVNFPCGRKPEHPEKNHDFRQSVDGLFSHESVARIEPTNSEVKGACSDDCATDVPHHSPTRSYPSEEENCTKTRSKTCKCKRTLTSIYTSRHTESKCYSLTATSSVLHFNIKLLAANIHSQSTMILIRHSIATTHRANVGYTRARCWAFAGD
jgi:hypothetical protein